MKIKFLFIFFIIPLFISAQNGPTLQEQYEAMGDPVKEKALREKYSNYNNEIDRIADDALNHRNSNSFDTVNLDNSEFVKSKIKKLENPPQNPYKAGQSYSFDPNKYNFKRFKESPCFEELGFSPFWNQDELEKKYQDCESEKSRQFWFYVLRTAVFSILLIGGMYLLIRTAIKT